MMDDFRSLDIPTDETKIFIRWSGSGPPLLLLHGFPQTHLMWREIAARLRVRFTVVCADLRGYGRSGCPASSGDHTPYTKRAMAADMVKVMGTLGFARFFVAGHDRGGRVAYRMALDHPECVTRLSVLDVVPIATAWERANADFALAFWPWSLLAQPCPLPERVLSAVPDAIVDNALQGWGSPAIIFPPEIRSAYIEALRDPAHAHAICEEYRAAASIDRDHDNVDRTNGRRITCPVQVLWSKSGALGTWYSREGGPLALWNKWADHVEGIAIDGGHFFPEECPEETAAALTKFFSGA